MNTSIRIRKLEDKISNKLDKKTSIWPILGGAFEGDPYRDVTPEEGEILKHKGVPIPICIALSREDEFQEYLKT